MRITQEGDYALRVVLYLCKRGVDEKIEARAIAESEKIPLRFLLKLLRKLTAAGIVKSYRGIRGGYALAKLPEQISLKAVIEAIEGPICVNRCLYDPGFCNLNRTASCAVHDAFDKIQSRLVADLERTTFKEILGGDS